MTPNFPDDDPIPPASEIIELRVPDLRHLFDSIDPAPFRERDLDPKVEQFIVEWGREVPRDVPLALRVHIDNAACTLEERTLLRDAVHRYFSERATSTRRRLRQLFRFGRVSLTIGLAVLVTLTLIAEFVAARTHSGGIGELVREGLSIGGWVAMWRPLEVFLYEWWPIRAEARLYDRLATMPVSVGYSPAETQL